MKEEVLERNIRRIKWGAIIVGAVVAVLFAWIVFFSSTKCESWSCFNANLKACDSAVFIGGEKMIFEYAIRSETSAGCRVDVTLLQGDLNSVESKKLEGHEMVCTLPLKRVMLPESDLGNCHGILKENLQDIIIQRLHNYIAQNLGRINFDILKAPPIPKVDNSSV